MNDHPSPHSWPPLIVARDVPRWVKVRDFVLTLMMWGLFLAMLESEFELIVQRNLVRLGLGTFRTDPLWEKHFELLEPYALVTLALVVVLLLDSAVTLVRRRRARASPQPPPLGLAAEARRAGLKETDLAAARELKIAVVYIEPDGRHRVEPR